MAVVLVHRRSRFFGAVLESPRGHRARNRRYFANDCNQNRFGGGHNPPTLPSLLLSHAGIVATVDKPPLLLFASQVRFRGSYCRTVSALSYQGCRRDGFALPQCRCSQSVCLSMAVSTPRYSTPRAGTWFQLRKGAVATSSAQVYWHVIFSNTLADIGRPRTPEAVLQHNRSAVVFVNFRPLTDHLRRRVPTALSVVMSWPRPKLQRRSLMDTTRAKACMRSRTSRGGQDTMGVTWTAKTCSPGHPQG